MKIFVWLLLGFSSINIFWYAYLYLLKGRRFTNKESNIGYFIFCLQIVGFGIQIYYFYEYFLFSMLYVFFFNIGFFFIKGKDQYREIE